MLTHFRKISFFLAYLVASIPLWHYISEAHILLLMTSVVIFAYINVVLSSVDAAKAILASEKAKTPLPRWLPQKPKYEKWWLIVRHTLKWHLLLVPAKMGLALACTQWLFVNHVPSSFYVIHETYTYIGYNLNFDYAPYPQLQNIILATILIIMFAIVENNILAAIILLTSNLLKQIKTHFFVLLTRTMFSLCLMSLFLFIRPLESLHFEGNSFSICVYANPFFRDGEELQRAYQDCAERRIAETIYTALLTPFDQSILLTANVMRPTITWAEGHFVSYSDPLANNRDDYSLFVLRQCVAGILGIFLYLSTTWAILCFAEDEQPASHI